MDALKPAFESVLGAAAGPTFAIVAIGVLFTFLGNMVTWSIGANESIAATGMDATAPGIFGHKHPKNGTPDYAFYLMGAIATALTIATYALFGTNDGIFWAIFTVSSIVFLLPYLLMFPSIVVLRRKFPDHPRPYKVPGGNTGALIWAILCEAGILLTLVLFFVRRPRTRRSARSTPSPWAAPIISVASASGCTRMRRRRLQPPSVGAAP